MQKHKSSYFLIEVILLTGCIIFSPAFLQAQLNEVSEEELSQVSAQSGITRVIGDSQFRVTLDSYRISDTDHSPRNWMELNNITIDDGLGGYFSMDTPANEADFNTIDVGTDSSGRFNVLMNMSTNVEPRTYTVGNFVFCDQDLGSIKLSNVRHGTDMLTIGSHMDGTCGIDMEYQTKIDIDSLTYTYNFSPLPNFPRSLVLSGIHLSQFSLGSPEDPTSWISMGKFKFGDLANDNPITLDVGTNENTGVTSCFMNIPMQGTARVENVEFHKQDFGPIAIDGINVHHLCIQIPGN